jgi:PilZ domain
MSTPNNQDRRAGERMDIQQEVQFRTMNRREPGKGGSGKTVNISSSGVLFQTDDTLATGHRIELDIDWPARLNDKCALKLVARGRVVRYQKGLAALEIVQHEFRTKSSRPAGQ